MRPNNRVPRDPNDPASALPHFSEYMAEIKALDTEQGVSLEDLVPADSNVYASHPITIITLVIKYALPAQHLTSMTKR